MTSDRLRGLQIQIKPSWIVVSVASALLLALPFAARLDGQTHAAWQQFLGRFHPAVVHLPIGILALVPLFELAGWLRPNLREGALVLLVMAVPATLLAVVLGYLLAYGGGTSGSTVTNHMWSAIVLTIGVMVCLVLRPGWIDGRLSYAYPGLLLAMVLLTAWTGHQGGAMTYGKDYLTEFAPFRGHATTKVDRSSFYGQHIDPILDANCVACHSESKVKGKLRLDTYALLMKGGEEGPAIVPGKPEQSILFKRITLPATDKHFMPTEGKPPLKPQEIAWIKAWILDGASETAATVAGVSIAAKKQDVPLPQVGDYSKLAGEIAQAEHENGIRLIPVSMKPGDGLILDAVDAGRNFGNAQLAHLDKLAPYIVEAQLGRTSVTDDAIPTLANYKHLRALHLEGTAITGRDLATLSHLPELEYLNLSGTKVTHDAVAPLTAVKHLHSVYLYNTPAQPLPSSTP